MLLQILTTVARASVFAAAFALVSCSPAFATYNGTTLKSASVDEKPTIAIIHGAFVVPAQYARVTAILNSRGYHTILRQNPSQISNDPEAHTVATDTDFVRNKVLLPEVNAGREVVLLMHSYGGFIGAAAADGLSKKELKAQGKLGGIIGMIMLSAFVAEEGKKVLDYFEDAYPPWMVQFVHYSLPYS